MKNQISSALRGFLLCIVPTLTVLGAFYLIAIEIFPADRGLDYEQYVLWATMRGAIHLVTIFTIYWLTAVVVGLKHNVGAPIANLTLVIATAGILFLTANSIFFWIDGYCDELPFPHEGFQLAKIYECPSSSTFLGLIGWGSLVLFVFSLAFRAVSSRRT